MGCNDFFDIRPSSMRLSSIGLSDYLSDGTMELRRHGARACIKKIIAAHTVYLSDRPMELCIQWSYKHVSYLYNIYMVYILYIEFRIHTIYSTYSIYIVYI